MIERYHWSGDSELIQWFGEADQPALIVFEPLFEERNRCRRMIAQMARELNKAQISVAIPDLPGVGESLTGIETLNFENWASAAQSACDALTPVGIISMRGGVLAAPASTRIPHWSFAPEQGTRIVRDLERVRKASGDEGYGYSGHPLIEQFVASLSEASFNDRPSLHVVRLESDAGMANEKVTGAPLWRRAEPGEDEALSNALAHSIKSWGQSCGAW